MKGGNGLAILIGEAKAKKPKSADSSAGELPEDENEESDESEHDDEAMKAAADEVFDALESKDRDAFYESLKSFVEAC